VGQTLVLTDLEVPDLGTCRCLSVRTERVYTPSRWASWGKAGGIPGRYTHL